jgi:hypothetical protein
VNDRLISVLLWTGTFVAVAVVIAAGMRLVSWMLAGGGDAASVWKAAGALILAATGGGSLVSLIRSRDP